MPRPAGPPAKTITISVPVELLDRIDADVAARGKANRTAWIIDLATALLDGRIMNNPKARR